MKIFVDQGKNNSMVVRLMNEWGAMGHQISDVRDTSDVHFSSPVFSTPSSIIPRILRMDGAHYNSESPIGLANLPLARALKTADGVIYQSQFSKNLTEKYLGLAKTSTIIYNGGDPTWNRPFPHPDYFNIAICSNWRRWKRFEEMSMIFKELVAGYPTAYLHIFGEVKDSPIWKHPRVKYYGYVDFQLLPTFYIIMDVGMHLAKRDACPNSLIEFVAAGFPVIVSDKGGGATELAQLIPGCEIAFDDEDTTGFAPVPQYTTKWNQVSSDFKDNVLSKLQIIYHDRRRVVLPTELTIRYCAEQYIKFMEEIINEKSTALSKM